MKYNNTPDTLEQTVPPKVLGVSLEDSSRKDRVDKLRKQTIISIIISVICAVGFLLWCTAIDVSMQASTTGKGMAKMGPALVLGVPAIILFIIAIVSGFIWYSARRQKDAIIQNQTSNNVIKKQSRLSNLDIIFLSLVIFIEIGCLYSLFDRVEQSLSYHHFGESLVDFSWSGLPIVIILTAITTLFLILKFSPKLKFLYLFLMLLALANMVSPYIAISLALFAGITSAIVVRFNSTR